MPNLAATLKEEISRLARKEIKGSLTPLRKAANAYRRKIAALKGESAALKSALAKAAKQSAASPSIEEHEGPKARFSPKSVIAQRKRLGLSAADFGKVIGVSGATIYGWEQGKTRPRNSQSAALAAARSIGKKEAKSRLEATGTNTRAGEPSKRATQRKRKTR